MDIDKDPIRVNKVLGKRASIGPIPADQLLPWVALGCLAYFCTRMLFGLPMIWWLGTWIWFSATWWILTGTATYKYIKSWVSPPGHDWLNAETLFVSAIDSGTFKRMRGASLNFVKMQTSKGLQLFMPFQNFSHLHSIAEIRMGGYTFACLILYDKKTDAWSAQIPFVFDGIHPQLYRQEVEQILTALYKGMGELPNCEYLTFIMAGRSHTRHRKQQLQSLAKGCNSDAIAVLTLNEQQRVKEISESGARQVWAQTIWCSWTAARSTEARTDEIGKALLWLQKHYQNWIRSFVGTQQTHFNDFYSRLARELYENGFLRWKNLLETKNSLQIRPMAVDELWEWLWYKFNSRQAPKLPQCIRIAETESGLSEDIPISGQKDLLTLLIQGDRGQTSCPKHKQQRGYIYVNGMVGKVVVIEQPPELWRNGRQQLSWIWDRLSTSYVRDTEVVVQVTPRERWSTQDELEKMSRQSYTEKKRALTEGTGRGVHADLQSEYAEDALRKMLEGKQPLSVAPVFVIWRQSERAADEAAAQFCNAFGAAHAVSEEDIAWRIWVEALPINSFPLLKKFSLFSERRITLDSESVAGFLPLTRPRDLDLEGVEFLSDRGGHPVYVDLLDSQKGRVLITGKTGSGKSVLGWRFLQEALAQGVPVVGLDLSAGGNSTFATAVQIMGEDRAAWIDILQSRLNILEPPYLGNLPPEVQLSRLKRWKDLVRTAIVAIAMGEIDDPKLRDRVDSICLRLIDVFSKDTVIVNRYNEAFEGGWRSLAWQDMPTLHDLLTFCSPQKLQLESVGDMDEAAINQILSQVGAKLRDPNIGGVIGRPSSVSPDAAITFYALSGLTNEQNAFIMAIVAQMACLRNALAHPRSMFVGDELSVLLSKRGFASLVGELLATGRKEGISVLMLAQDLDAIVDCDAAAQILANLSTVITGLTTYAATNTYEQSLGYPKEIISRNATDAYKANPAQLYTRWLIERNKRFWDTRFYAAPMMLAALANSEQEKAARMRILENFEPTELGYLQGLRAFTDEYVQALRGSKRLQDIGRFQEGGWGAGSGGASLKRKSRGVGREGALNSPYSLLPAPLLKDAFCNKRSF